MKKYIVLLGLFAAVNATAQSSDANQDVLQPFHHSGFQASVYVGGAFGDVNGDVEGVGSTVIRGSVMHVMMHIGYAKKDWSAGFAFGTNSLSIRSMSANGMTYAAIPNWSIDNGLTGIYVKRYFMPLNIFVSVEAGIGKFTFYDNNDLKTLVETDKGMSWNLTAGKEFLMGKKKRWGLGGYINFGGINCHDLPPYTNDKYSYLAPGIGLAVSFH